MEQEKAIQFFLFLAYVLVNLALLASIPLIDNLLKKVATLWFKINSKRLFQDNLKEIKQKFQSAEKVKQNVYWAEGLGVRGSVDIEFQDETSLILSLYSKIWWIGVKDKYGRQITLESEGEIKSFLFEKNLKESDIESLIANMETRSRFKVYKFGNILDCNYIFTYTNHYTEALS